MSLPQVKLRTWSEGVVMLIILWTEVICFCGKSDFLKVWSYNNLGECFLEPGSKTLPGGMRT